MHKDRQYKCTGYVGMLYKAATSDRRLKFYSVTDGYGEKYDSLTIESFQNIMKHGFDDERSSKPFQC